MNTPLFLLPEKISQEDSQIILKHTLQEGLITSIMMNGVPHFIWMTFQYRRPVLTQELIDQFKKLNRMPDYWLRSRTDLEWQWVDSAQTSRVKVIINSLAPYIKSLTRVQSLILIPGNALPSHTDKVAGTRYGNNDYIFGLGYENENQFHHNNDYLAIKIPLFSEQGFGRPFIEIDGKIHEFAPDGHVYVINEVEIKHGAYPVDYPRGVIVMDGILNLDAIYLAGRSMFPKRY